MLCAHAHRNHALQQRSAHVWVRGRLARQRQPWRRLCGRPAARPLALISRGRGAPACSAVCTITTVTSSKAYLDLLK